MALPLLELGAHGDALTRRDTAALRFAAYARGRFVGEDFDKSWRGCAIPNDDDRTQLSRAGPPYTAPLIGLISRQQACCSAWVRTSIRRIKWAEGKLKWWGSCSAKPRNTPRRTIRLRASTVCSRRHRPSELRRGFVRLVCCSHHCC